jgi:hypothetical protein
MIGPATDLITALAMNLVAGSTLPPTIDTQTTANTVSVRLLLGLPLALTLFLIGHQSVLATTRLRNALKTISTALPIALQTVTSKVNQVVELKTR